MIARALKLSPADEFAGSFSDVSDLAVWAKGGVAALANEGYVQGAAGKLSPTANITRAEFAQVMKNVIAHYINEAGTYTDDYSGNVMINVADVVLNGSEVTGDVILGDGVGDGDVTLEDVTISGKLVVRGGGANSIVIKGDSNIGTVIIARVDGEIRIIAEDGVKIDVVIIDDGSDDVVLEGEFGTVTVLAEGIVLDTSKATVEELVDETGTLEVVEPQDPAPPVVEDDDWYEPEPVKPETTYDAVGALDTWVKDRTEPKSWSEDEGYITIETKDEPANNWYAWQGKSSATDVSLTTDWEVETELELTQEMVNRDGIRASIWIAVEGSENYREAGWKGVIDWSILQFKKEDSSDTAGWQYWDASGSGAWVDLVDFSITPGIYKLTTVYKDGTIYQYINDSEVNSYDVNTDSGISSPTALIIQSYSFGESYNAKWKVPEIQFITPIP